MSTRDQILEAANSAYVEQGYSGMSLRGVAKRVGLTPMAIYRHFKDKDHLMHHVVLNGLALFSKQMQKAARTKDPWKRLERVGREYVDFSEEHRFYFEVVFLSTDRLEHLRHLTPEGSGAFDQVFATYESWVAQCLPSGTPANQVRETAIDIWAYAHGLVALKLAGRLSFLNVAFARYHNKKLKAYLDLKRSEFEDPGAI